MSTRILTLGLGLGVGLATAAAEAQVTLTFADWQVPAASTTREAGAVFMEKATELSGGELVFEYYPAEQLGRVGEMLQLLQTGVADIAHVAPAHATDRFPMSTVPELPGLSLDSCALADATYAMMQPGGLLYEAEFGPNGVRVLFAGNLGPYTILTRQRAVTALSDLSGLNIRTAGGPMEMTVTALGANAIRMTGAETLPSLTRGTLDGVVWPIPLVKDWGLEEPLNHMTPNLSTGSFVNTYAVSDAVWNRLTESQREALVEAGQYATQRYCEYVNRTWAEARDELEEVFGLTRSAFSDEELANAQERFDSVHQDWVAGLAGGRVSSQEVYDTFRAHLGE